MAGAIFVVGLGAIIYFNRSEFSASDQAGRPEQVDTMIRALIGSYTFTDGSGDVVITDGGIRGYDGRDHLGMIEINFRFPNMDAVAGSNTDVPISYSHLFFVHEINESGLSGTYRHPAQPDQPGSLTLTSAGELRLVNGSETTSLQRR